ncbi:MAG: thiamine phosphate synthase [Candidatus Hydrogenedentes bacterium]|nr:thiamine phosphate synthase [Candidatus Hydrogenedentota bacterium]
MTHAERMARFAGADLYVVITEAHCAGRRAVDVLDAVLDAGVRLIQFREKDLDGGELYRRAAAFRERTAEHGALLIVDDRVDVALAVEADGVHLGQGDLPVRVARAIAPDLVIGASTHDLHEAIAAQRDGASYVNIGPIFSTQTKRVAGGAIGPEAIEAICPHLRIPFTTMGGIKAHNIAQVLDRGARHVAVVTAVTEADDPREAARALRDIMRRAR